jgi:hypothetical protein
MVLGTKQVLNICLKGVAMEGLPCLRNGSVCFGPISLRLADCNMDTLVENFGDAEYHEILGGNTFIQVLHFWHPWGKVHAFLKFNEGDLFYPAPIVPHRWEMGRGKLLEIQLELDVPLGLKYLGMPKVRIVQEKYEFALYRKRFLARLIDSMTLDVLSFYNHLYLGRPEKTFLFNQYFQSVDTPASVRVTEQVAEVRRQIAKEQQQCRTNHWKFLTRPR